MSSPEVTPHGAALLTSHSQVSPFDGSRRVDREYEKDGKQTRLSILWTAAFCSAASRALFFSSLLHITLVVHAVILRSMAVALERHVRRDDSPAFDSRMFYTLNNLNLPRYTLSAGMYTESNGAINLTDYGSLSSENWQLFFQSGRYFIRNYDYGAKWQLGLTEDSRTVPKLYPRSGSISQQWTLNKVNGGWEMVNELWGAGTAFALPRNWPMAAMRSEPDGTVWNITSNPR